MIVMSKKQLSLKLWPLENPKPRYFENFKEAMESHQSVTEYEKTVEKYLDENYTRINSNNIKTLMG